MTPNYPYASPMNAYPSGMSPVASMFMSFISLAVLVLVVASLWVIFKKAGEAGWKAIIPIYNGYILLKIVGHSPWWLILYFIPIVNIVIALIVSLDLARSFGKGTGFGIGIWLLGIIFYPILAFGSAKYIGPAAKNFMPDTPADTSAGSPRSH